MSAEPSSSQARPSRKHDPAEANRLKLLGNEHYQKGEYEAAKIKYSEAIKKDPSNAILYANRAAVYLATKENIEAAMDCRKCVKLDPTYAKGWARLGSSTHTLAAWSECLHAWQKALDCLPKSNLSPVEDQMKSQFTQGLRKAKAASEPVVIKSSDPRFVGSQSPKLPWINAMALRSSRLAAGKPSCVEAILQAYQDFQEALTYLPQQKMMSDRGIMTGNPNCMQPLTNSILTESRVFHLPSADFSTKINNQCVLENSFLRGWVEAGGIETIKKEVKSRIRREGWASARPALIATVRIWILQGFFKMLMQGLDQYDFAHEMYHKARTLLEWGREEYRDVPIEERGSIFERSFIRGIKRLQVDLMLQSLMARTPTRKSRYTIPELIDAARDLIEDVESDRVDIQTIPAVHYRAFWTNIKASALAALAWATLQNGLSYQPTEEEYLVFMTEATGCYQEAAGLLPTDDFYHAQYLVKHLECLGYLNATLRLTLSVCERIREAGKDAAEIWQIGAWETALKSCVDQARQYELKWTKEIEQGRCTLDSIGK